eukprot:2458032-Rhodomonas_salina.1
MRAVHHHAAVHLPRTPPPSHTHTHTNSSRGFLLAPHTPSRSKGVGGRGRREPAHTHSHKRVSHRFGASGFRLLDACFCFHKNVGFRFHVFRPQIAGFRPQITGFRPQIQHLRGFGANLGLVEACNGSSDRAFVVVGRIRAACPEIKRNQTKSINAFLVHAAQRLRFFVVGMAGSDGVGLATSVPLDDSGRMLRQYV